MLALSGTSFASSKFPARPMKIIVPFAPGGSNDLIARMMAPKFYETFGQSVVVENKAGAGGAIGAQVASRSDPDGYTILFHSSTLVIQPSLVNSIGYEYRDFVPVSMLSEAPLVFEVSPSVPAKTMAEFVEYARSKDSEIFFGSAGHGSTQHLAGELFNKVAGTNMTHVPFQGNAPATQALLAGNIQVVFDIVPLSRSLAQENKVRLLGVTSRTRNHMLPDVPSISETVPDFGFTFWQGMSLPKGSPDEAVQAWYEAGKKALASEDVRNKLEQQGYSLVGSSPAEFKKRMDEEFNLWAKIISEAGIKV